MSLHSSKQYSVKSVVFRLGKRPWRFCGRRFTHLARGIGRSKSVKRSWHRGKRQFLDFDLTIPIVRRGQASLANTWWTLTNRKTTDFRMKTGRDRQLEKLRNVHTNKNAFNNHQLEISQLIPFH